MLKLQGDISQFRGLGMFEFRKFVSVIYIVFIKKENNMIILVDDKKMLGKFINYFDRLGLGK